MHFSAGQALISCRPRFVTNELKAKIPTAILVGESDVGKTHLGELTLAPFGHDPETGRVLSFNHCTEFEFGQKVARSSVPIIVNDPPKSSAADYAQLVVNVADGTRRKTKALEYIPGAGPILCVNNDFLNCWRDQSEELWYGRISHERLTFWCGNRD